MKLHTTKLLLICPVSSIWNWTVQIGKWPVHHGPVQFTDQERNDTDETTTFGRAISTSFCYNLGKLIEKNTYGFYLYHGNCLGEMKCNLLFFHINFNHKNTKAQILFLLTQWLLIPVRLFSRKWSFWKEASGLNFKFRTKMTLLSKKSQVTPNSVMGINMGSFWLWLCLDVVILFCYKSSIPISLYIKCHQPVNHCQLVNHG